MLLTNKLNLPEAFVRAIRAFPYSKGDANISCTGLIKPPLMTRLEHDHWEEIEEDVSDRLWALRGTIIHYILEKGAPDDCLPETRFFTQVDGWRVSGQADAYFPSSGLLMDWKETSVWATREGVKREWTEQLNVLAHLVRKNGGDVNQLQVLVMYRDWRPSEAKSKSNYPPTHLDILPVTMWTPEQALEFVKLRVEIHKEALAVPEVTMIPECDPDEMWQRPDVWAVMKEGRKSAVKLHETEESAKEHLSTLDSKHSIVMRPGERVRCESYCLASKWCPYFKRSEEN